VEHRPAAGVAVDVRGLSFAYPTPDGPLTVLDDVSFSLPAGGVAAITGPSGSGKTTLLSLLGGLDRVPRGIVQVADHELGALSRAEIAAYRRDVVGFVFQDFGLLGQLTALENVELALMFGGGSRRRRRERARGLLSSVGLAHRLGHRPRALSGGEKQRVAIARALANEPRLVLADEPTGNLDAVSTATVLDVLLRIPTERGATVVVCTHDQAIAARAATRLHIDEGRLVVA